MNRILYLSYYWPPSGGPGVQRALKFVKYFSEFNVDPYLVTVNEKKASYPLLDESLVDEIPDSIRVHKTNSFEPLALYKKLNKQKEIPYSGFVNMDKTTLFQKVSRFIRGNFFIPDARIGWKSYAVKRCMKLIEQEDFKAIVTSSPPHSTQLAGLKIKQKTGLPWIADLRDPWTDIYYYNDFYHLPFVKKHDASLERKVLENADVIVVVSESIKKLFLSKSDQINPKKIHVIPNGFDEADFISDGNPRSDEFVITYMGTLADQYPIDEFISALAKTIKINEGVKIKWKIIGKVSENILEKIKKNSLSKYVDYVGYKQHKEAVSTLLASDVLLLVIPDIDNNSGILTGKLFEYLAAQKPIILIGPRNGDAAKIIAECKAGRNFDYIEGMPIYAYITELITKWKRSKKLNLQGKTYKKYSRRELTKVFAQIIKDL